MVSLFIEKGKNTINPQNPFGNAVDPFSKPTAPSAQPQTNVSWPNALPAQPSQQTDSLPGSPFVSPAVSTPLATSSPAYQPPAPQSSPDSTYSPFAANPVATAEPLPPTSTPAPPVVQPQPAPNPGPPGTFADTGAFDHTSIVATPNKIDKLKLSTSKPVLAGATVAVIAITVAGGFLMFNGKNKPSAAPLTAEAKQNLERKVDLYAIERSLVQYSGSHAGQYPTLAQINDNKFRSTAMAGMSLDQTTDPIGRTGQLSGEAGAGVYHYEALPKGCDNKSVKCTDHKVVATLSDGQQISVPQ